FNVTNLPHSAMSPKSPHSDLMQMTSPSSVGMCPPGQSSPEVEQGVNITNGNGEGSIGNGNSNGNGNQSVAAAAAAAAQGPKVVQTAFIHKLYNMLEDRSIQHLISWSNTNESFVMSPSNEFSKVLAQYF